MCTASPRPLPHCCQTIAQGADCPAGGLVCMGQHQGDEGTVAAVQPLDAPQAIAEPGGGQRRSLADHNDGAAPGQGEQHVVGAVAIVVHPHGGVVWVGVGDQGGDAVEHGHGVQWLGQQPEPLLREWDEDRSNGLWQSLFKTRFPQRAA